MRFTPNKGVTQEQADVCRIIAGRNLQKNSPQKYTTDLKTRLSAILKDLAYQYK